MKVAELKALAREHGLRGYSRLRKAALIALLRDNLQLSSRPTSREPTPPIPAPRHPPATRTRLRGPREQRSPPPSPTLVRFRPDRPRQPELLRKLEERNPQPPKPLTPLAEHSGPRASAPTLKPYQLKHKRGKETFMEPRMKKKLDELNRKIRHSIKKYDVMIHKRNALRKAIEELKWGNAKQPTRFRGV